MSRPQQCVSFSFISEIFTLHGYSLTTAIFGAVKCLQEIFDLVAHVKLPIGAQRHAGGYPWQEGRKRVLQNRGGLGEMAGTCWQELVALIYVKPWANPNMWGGGHAVCYHEKYCRSSAAQVVENSVTVTMHVVCPIFWPDSSEASSLLKMSNLYSCMLQLRAAQYNQCSVTGCSHLAHWCFFGHTF